jgi:hypothetical protein
MYKRYFNTGLKTVNNVVTIYNIFSILIREAEHMYVTNNGSNKMFVQTYTNKKGKLYPNKECWIYPKRVRRFHDVHEILIAKTPIGNQYRISELIMLADQNTENKGLMTDEKR